MVDSWFGTPQYYLSINTHPWIIRHCLQWSTIHRTVASGFANNIVVSVVPTMNPRFHTIGTEQQEWLASNLGSSIDMDGLNERNNLLAQQIRQYTGLKRRQKTNFSEVLYRTNVENCRWFDAPRCSKLMVLTEPSQPHYNSISTISSVENSRRCLDRTVHCTISSTRSSMTRYHGANTQCMFVCLSIRTIVCLSVSQSVSQSVHLYDCLCVYPSVSVSTLRLSVHR